MKFLLFWKNVSKKFCVNRGKMASDKNIWKNTLLKKMNLWLDLKWKCWRRFFIVEN